MPPKNRAGVINFTTLQISPPGLSFAITSWYLGRESTVNAYGAAGSVVLLLCVYYASCILLFGAEFTQVYAHAHGRHIRPAVNAVRVSRDERLNEGMDEQGHGGKEPHAAS